MRKPTETWFDRLNRYRIAAVFLAIPTAWNLIDDVSFTQTSFELTIRVLYRTGMVILLVAIAMDWWAVYTGKRRIKQMIRQKKITNPHGS